MDVREELATKIAGEIVLNPDPGAVIRKWREIMDISPKELANGVNVTQSVISDYERGRRKSPGSAMVKKMVNAMIKSDEDRGSRFMRAYERIRGNLQDSSAIKGIREFNQPVAAREFLGIVKGRILANEDLLEKYIYGYTILDSLKAILELSSQDFLKIYGVTSERALVFTRVSTGRSPFIAIRVSSLKPGLVILNGLKDVDPLAIKIAQMERIPLILSEYDDDELFIALEKCNY